MPKKTVGRGGRDAGCEDGDGARRLSGLLPTARGDWKLDSIAANVDVGMGTRRYQGGYFLLILVHFQILSLLHGNGMLGI